MNHTRKKFIQAKTEFYRQLGYDTPEISEMEVF